MRWLCAAALAALGVLLAAPKAPIYIGAKACAQCHDGGKVGDQYGKWLTTKHAIAYPALLKPESWEIAKRSGLRGKPWEEPICLGCHATAFDAEDWEKDDDFQAKEGMQCEACHGPGSEYAEESVMRDRKASKAAGLRMPGPEVCMGCHVEKNSHTSVITVAKFDPLKARAEIAHPKGIRVPGPRRAGLTLPPEPPRPTEPRYMTPINLAFRPGTSELWATCEAGNAVTIVDASTRRKIAEIPVGDAPFAVAFTPDGSRAFVTNREDDNVSVIDAASRKVVKILPAGDEPHGVITDAEGRRVYILNTSSNDIFVYNAQTLDWEKKLSAGRGPWSAALEPGGARILVSSMYSHLTGYRKPLKSEVTVIEAASGAIGDRWMASDTNLMMGIAWHPTGEFALATMNRTRNLVPMTRLLQGWVITNGLAVLWKDGTVNEVLLDLPGQGFADASDVAFTPDGRYALVTSAGTDTVAVVDVARLKKFLLSATPEERRNRIPLQLGPADDFVAHWIRVGARPRGVAVSPDGTSAFVATGLDDSLTVLDLRSMKVSGSVDLGVEKTLTKARAGERLFHSANITFRRQFSCSSCHPDGHVDGIAYDIESDGIGVSPVDNRTLRGINDTAPFKWEGTNPSLSRQCGARLSIFFTRIQPFTPEELSAVDYYITTIRRPVNRHRKPGEPLTAAQRRGRRLFYRTAAVDGRDIPVENRCSTCHMPPYYTNRQTFDVGTRQTLDRQAKFDVPHLNNIYDSAPYLHNGMAATLEEIWTVFNPRDTHGMTNDLTKDQLNDLIEFLKTL